MPSNPSQPVDLRINIYHHSGGVSEVYLRLNGFETTDYVGHDWQHYLADLPLGTTLTVTVTGKTRKTEEHL